PVAIRIFSLRSNVFGATQMVCGDRQSWPHHETSRCEASHLLFPAPAFVHRDVLLVAHEIPDRRLSSKRKIDAKELARTHTRKGQRGFAQGLARDRARVDPGAT